MQIKTAGEDYVRWLITTQDLSVHTIRAYRSDIGALHRHVGTDVLATNIDRSHVLGFLEAQRGAGLASASIRRRAASLRGFCRWLVARQLLESDPWSGVTVGNGKSRRLPRLLPQDDLALLLRFLREQSRCNLPSSSAALLRASRASTTLLAVALMLSTGVRVAELVSIRCADVDFEGGTVRVLGKGRRERQVFLTNTWIVELLRAYFEMRSILEVDHAQVLFNVHCRPLTASAVRVRLRKAGEDAGLRTKPTPHMLRHAAATQLVEAGVDIRLIQRLLGHASVTTTEIYTHVNDRALRQIVCRADVLGAFVCDDN